MTHVTEGIGERIALARRNVGLSAQTLADAIGGSTSRSVIANIESGRKKDVTVEEVFAIADVLGVPPIALLLPLTDPLGRYKLREDGLEYDLPEIVEWFLVQRTGLSSKYGLGGSQNFGPIRRLVRKISEYFKLMEKSWEPKGLDPDVEKAKREVEQELLILSGEDELMRSS